MTQSRITFAELLDEVIREGGKIEQETLAKLKALQPEYFAVIRSYTRADGTINPSRVNSLYRDLQELEESYSDVLVEKVEEGVSNVSKIVGAFLIDRIFPRGMKSIEDPFAYLYDREVDGLTLKDRSDIMGGSITDSLRQRMRRSIYQGAQSSEIYDHIVDTFEGEEWKAKRLVTSEMNNSYRGQFAETLQKNGEQYVRFYESKWCTHRNHNRHRCHILAHEDRYGLGEGVFKVTDSEIYAPHPQCRGYLGFYEGGE